MKSVSYKELYKDLERIKSDDYNYLISIVIPVYNEDKTILSLLNNLPNNRYIELVVIDDHSWDNSICEIEKAQNNLNIKLYKHKKNRGYGEAILTGIKKSTGKIIITMDADGQHQPEDIYTLVKPIIDKGVDFTIGSRYLGSYHYELPLSTRMGEVVVEKLIQLFFGKKVMNNQGGFRAFDRKIIKIFDNIQYKNYAFTTELIIRALIYGYRIKETPIRLLDRAHGKSRIILNKLVYNLFTCFLRYLFLKIKMKIFNETEINFQNNPIFFKEIN